MALKIRTWSLIAVSSALLPLIAFFIVALLYIDSREQALIDAELKYRTSQIAQVANERLAVTVQTLHVLSQSKSARNGDWPALYEQARQVIKSNPNYTAVTLTDEKDNLVFVTSLPYGEKSFKARYPHLVLEVMESGKPNVSGPFTVPIARGYRIAVSVPLIRGDRVTNVLRMIVSTDSIDEILRQQQLPAGWIAAIADRDGILVARSVSASEYVGKPASRSLAAAIQRGDSHIYRGVSLEGKAITSVVYPIFQGHWHASIAVPDEVLEAHSRRTMLILLAMSIGAALLGVGAAAIGAHFIDQQTKKLEGAVGARGGDTPAAPPPTGIKEFSDLYQSFCDIIESEQKIETYLKQVTSEKNEIRDLYEHAPCGYHSLDASGCYVRINQTELDWLGLKREDVLGQPFKKFITESAQEEFDRAFTQFLAEGHIEDREFSLICSDGSSRPVAVNATLIRDDDGKPLMSRSILFDITQRKKLEQRLEALSYMDSMTGLSNRRHFYELAGREIERAVRLKSPFALGILDVDHFKLVNDEFGHAVGDRLLTSLGVILKSKMRTIDIPARIGGEEFALLLPHTDADSASQVLERLREEMAAAVLTTNDGRTVTFTVSIGFTIQQIGETDLDAILSRADKALYLAKGQGRNRVCSA